MNRRKLALVVVALVLLAVAGPFYALSADSNKPEQPVPAIDNASVASKTYVETFVGDDGNAAKGGATTFGQQARGLLISAATADKARFDAIWNRTKADFAKPDGTFDQNPSDTLVAIRAFMVAADRIEDPTYDSDAHLLAATLEVPTTNVDASIMQTRTLEELAALPGGDAKWKAVATTLRDAQTAEFVNNKLLADKALPSNDTYSASAQMATLLLKDSCNAADATNATKSWKTLRLSPELRYATQVDAADGKIKNDEGSVQALVATAASAEVAGEHVQSLLLLDQADALAKIKNTPEALSWSAIGRIVVSTEWLGAC